MANFDDDLKAANTRMKREKYGVTIRSRGCRLNLRATLPPKPDSGKVRPYQQDHPLGVFANPSGLKYAIDEAKRMSADLGQRRFNWLQWGFVPKIHTRTVAEWLSLYEQQYFQENERNAKSETTWHKDYRLPILKLPQDAILTERTMLEVTLTKEADSRQRKRFYDAYSRFARFAGLEVNFGKLRGNYSASSVDHRNLPSDDLIREWRDRIPRTDWQWFYGVMAAYGIRSHEVFHIDLETIKKEPLIWITGGKTGEHFGLPFPSRWWEEWRLYEPNVPDVPMKNDSYLSTRASTYFRAKMKPETLPFNLNDLRHRWSIRTAEMGVGSEWTSKLQKHSQRIHDETYQRNTDESSFRDLQRRMQGKD